MNNTEIFSLFKYRIRIAFHGLIFNKSALIRANSDLRRKILFEVTKLSDAELRARPAENAWSVGEILHHLHLIKDLVINRMLKPTLTENTHMEFTSTNLIKPTFGLSKAMLLDLLQNSQEDTTIFIYEHFKELKSLPPLSHPRLKKVSAKSWLIILYLHEKKHLAQIIRTITKIRPC